jgi:hypothetical protein
MTECAGAWCVAFNHSGFLNKLRRRKLAYAYLPTGLFLTKMQAAGYSTAVVGCDHTFEVGNVDGSIGHVDDTGEIFYLSSHGRFVAGSGYDAILHSTLWAPGASGLGISRLVVAVIDTCSLIDGKLNWKQEWQNATIAPSVRLLLGFDGSAPGDKGSSQRGAAFADELLSGKTFADAWLIAVKNSLVSGTGTPVAIGVGDTAASAQSVLSTAAISSMPPARSGSTISFHAQY